MKMCPLMIASGEDKSSCECLKDECEWYDDLYGRCVIWGR